MKTIIYFGVALILPIILFVVILHNYNETHFWIPFFTCQILFYAAGYLTYRDNNKQKIDKTETSFWKWLIWCSLVGVAEALILYFAV